MIKVLFVCLGNICRSPMAEAMFRYLVKREGLEHKIMTDSAGTGNWHIGKPPHEGTKNILKKNQISTEGLTARQVKTRDLEEFDYIIAMDVNNQRDIEKLKAANPKAKISLLLDHAKTVGTRDVPDPYYTGNFEEVFQMVKEGCEQLLENIKSDGLKERL
ncbi:low molecular weight protein-tyrosine-phosphatase [Cytobacillus sp. FJAT-54145]|uniref:protein-tyrosine-phosphatase n=1 Tax=Cytobacillus spartinae TaxID=3299023 RepID=A0ABW6KB36_9BACI